MVNYSVTIHNNHDKAKLWQAFCATVVKLGESTSSLASSQRAVIYEQNHYGHTFFDFTQPPPVFTNLMDANDFIKRLWVECVVRLKNIQLQAKDSTNSSIPPSHDSISTKVERNANSKHVASGKKQGGQPGHKGHWRSLLPIEEVDTIVACYAPEYCKDCTTLLPKGDVFSRKQVSYLNEKRLTVTEFQRYQIDCPACGKAHKGKLPKGTPRGAFGECVHAVITLFTGRYHMTKRNVVECLHDLFGLKISTGSISNAEHTISQALAGPTDEVHEALKVAPVANNDETTFYCKHKLQWLWVMGNQELAYFMIQSSRNTQAAKAILGDLVTEVRITDRYGAYNFIPKKFRQFCWSHLTRDIKAVSEKENPSETQIGKQLEIARKAIFTQIDNYKVADNIAKLAIKAQIYQNMKLFRQSLRQGVSLKGTSTARFCRNLIKHWKCLWLFMRNSHVSPTNNHGERLLRQDVIWRGISHGTQSERGSRYVERISTTSQTCRLQKRHLLSYLTEAMVAYWAGASPPSLLLNRGGKI